MAKGQKKSNRETRKPKQEKAKPTTTPGTFLGLADRPPAGSSSGSKGSRR